MNHQSLRTSRRGIIMIYAAKQISQDPARQPDLALLADMAG
jgi:hypothetical protein